MKSLPADQCLHMEGFGLVEIDPVGMTRWNDQQCEVMDSGSRHCYVCHVLGEQSGGVGGPCISVQSEDTGVLCCVMCVVLCDVFCAV